MRCTYGKQISRAAAALSAKSRHPQKLSASGDEEEAGSVSLSSEGPGSCYGFNWALAGRGVLVKDKVFHNLSFSELQKNGATTVENLSAIPLRVRGNVVGGPSEISRAQFAKLLKQVTSHLSSVSNVFVHDGAVASAKCDAKVRVISDAPSAILSFSKLLWETPSRAISHDSCPMTVYIASSISPRISEALGFGTQVSIGFAAADIERSSLILCGKAFADASTIKNALSALAAPVISAREGLPVCARLLLVGDSIILLFSSEHTIQICPDLHQALVSLDAGVVLSSDHAAPYFKSRDHTANLLRKPASVVITSSDSTGVIPLVSKLSAGQAAYHFLAGYQDGKFMPAYSQGPSPVDSLALAKAFFLHIQDDGIPSFLVNVNVGGKHITGAEILRLAAATLSNDLPDNKPAVADWKVKDLKRKYKSFLSSKFQELPEEFLF